MTLGRRQWKYRRGSWAVARERHHIPEPFPSPPLRDSTPVARILVDLIARLGLQVKEDVADLATSWKGVVGEAVGRHTRPARLSDGTLTVYVDSSMWLSELQRFRKNLVLASVQKRLGADRVRAIALQLDPDGPAPYS